MIRCAFCGQPFEEHYPHQQAGIHTVKCARCRRAFIIEVKKRWWGWQRQSHVR